MVKMSRRTQIQNKRKGTMKYLKEEKYLPIRRKMWGGKLSAEYNLAIENPANNKKATTLNIKIFRILYWNK